VIWLPHYVSISGSSLFRGLIADHLDDYLESAMGSDET